MKSRPNLFEVMNKAPQTQSPGIKVPRLPFLSGLKKKQREPSQPIVAQALSEEEAAAEMAARRAAIEAAERAKAEARERVEAAKEAKRLAKLEQKARKQAAREAARQQAAELAARKAAEQAEATPRRPIIAAPARGGSWFRSSAGKFSFSLSTVGCMVVAGAFCALVAGAYVLGHRTSGDGKSSALTPAAAIANPDLLKDSTGAVKQPAVRKSGGSQTRQNPDLKELMAPPQAVLQNVTANQPRSLDSAQDGSAASAKKLNHVQIEWFPITVEKSSEDLLAEVNDVHRFLKARGIETFAQEMPRGYILYSMQGYTMSDKYRSERNALLKTIEQYGQEDFRSGGRYQFKDCLFVNYNNTIKGRPVSFKE